jgi:nitroimidazol reductase NimA-like FMN-containing flavoprotein (pyridoxamine 5'-phosphate oxidase superfamily)
MRRKEKEIVDRDQIDAIIRSAQVCRLAMIDGGEPYLVPLSFGYDGRAIYFHSAAEGRKVAALRRSARVCFEMETDVEPVRGMSACQWGMRYASVIGYGNAVFLSDADAKRRALELIMAHYADGLHAFPEKELARTLVFRVDIEKLAAKRSG